MKKIRCDFEEEDYIKVFVNDRSGCYIESKDGDGINQIKLSPEKIRKLRKQLKKAILKIEGA